MAEARDSLFTTDTVIQLSQEECDDYDARQSINSESDISDDTSDFEDFIQNSDTYSDVDSSTANSDKDAPKCSLIG